MSNYFFVARSRFNPGETLGGGHFGDGFKDYVFNDQSQAGALQGWRLASELIVEDVRKRFFPDRPSRLKCSFAWVRQSDAEMNLPVGLFVHEVRLQDPNAPVFVADFTLMSAASRFATSDTFISLSEAVAHKYWTGGSPQLAEVLTLSPLVVVKCLT
ncbi:MAG: hypothetical protein J0I36_08555 [Pandoraea sp.]|uniref:hypothetical protein n=1 Tax=Pandoraea sp. 64-18 TaxID=1895806 RepID=UPI00095EEF84|nr:hypothetical protein [Pandoraea sp. 64-18]MBN9115329.1 hypothetical protein [Pandoraea sp.]OJY23578.1 MAG: hypothetical protein BGP02_04725 [Pandoraea sp. 64-18]